jgi:hypothetical protein
MKKAKRRPTAKRKTGESTSVATYEERYCLFLDILGFASHVEETVSPKSDNKNPMTVLRLSGVLKRIASGVDYREAIEVSGTLTPSSRRVTQFSDSIVVSYLKNELSGSGVSSMLWDVLRLQLDLVRSGILLRGAMTSGRLYHDQNLVFGPALNEAVAFERLANYPRVILDGEILDEAGLRRLHRASRIPGSARSISSMVSNDFDGLYYVDYFNVHPDDFQDWAELSEYLERLRELIKGLANKREPSLKVKHSWLRTKFNAMAGPFIKSGFHVLGGQSVPENDVELFAGIKTF